MAYFSGYKTFKTASALIFFFFLENSLHEVWSGILCFEQIIIYQIKDIFHKFYLVHSWKFCPKYCMAQCKNEIFI